MLSDYEISLGYPFDKINEKPFSKENFETNLINIIMHNSNQKDALYKLGINKFTGYS
jgi:hypothetical protein